LCFGVGAQRWGIELLVQGVDFIKRLLIGLRAIVILFLSRVFGVIDFRFSVLGLVAFLERACISTVPILRAPWQKPRPETRA